MNFLGTLLARSSFQENAALLVLGAAITGILVPTIKARMDQRRFQEQKLFEAALARQASIIAAQTKLLATLSDLIWRFQLLTLEVSYDRLEGDKKEYTNAVSAYDAGSWQLLVQIRAEIGGSRWFVSDTTYGRLRAFYEEWLITLDERVAALIKNDASPDAWEQHHFWLYEESATQADRLIGDLSDAFDLRAIAHASHGGASAHST